jgi:TRAP-type C4-dicarboxylate transport system permease small subunit
MSCPEAVDKNAERWLLLLFYVMLVLTMFIEVVRRELFAYSSIWGEEIVRYSFIYLAWIGAAAAVKERGHIGSTSSCSMSARKRRPALHSSAMVMYAWQSLRSIGRWKPCSSLRSSAR